MRAQGAIRASRGADSSKRTVTPQSARTRRFLRNAGCRARSGFTHGATTIGTDRPMYSDNVADATVSAIPQTHLFTVLNVAGATTIASASGTSDGSSGCRQLLRTV